MKRNTTAGSKEGTWGIWVATSAPTLGKTPHPQAPAPQPQPSASVPCSFGERGSGFVPSHDLHPAPNTASIKTLARHHAGATQPQPGAEAHPEQDARCPALDPRAWAEPSGRAVILPSHAPSGHQGAIPSPRSHQPPHKRATALPVTPCSVRLLAPFGTLPRRTCSRQGAAAPIGLPRCGLRSAAAPLTGQNRRGAGLPVQQVGRCCIGGRRQGTHTASACSGWKPKRCGSRRCIRSVGPFGRFRQGPLWEQVCCMGYA